MSTTQTGSVKSKEYPKRKYHGFIFDVTGLTVSQSGIASNISLVYPYVEWNAIRERETHPGVSIITPVHVTRNVDTSLPYPEMFEDTALRIKYLVEQSKNRNFYIFLTNIQTKNTHQAVLNAGFQKVDEYVNPNTRRIITEYFYAKD